VDPNSVLGKVRLILDAFGPDDVDLSLTEIAGRTGVAKASIHRICTDLVGLGLLERNSRRYQLGLRLFELGAQVPRQRVLRRAALPIMEDLLNTTHEAVHLAVRVGCEVMYVEKLSPARHEFKPSRIAGRMPMHCTATGKVLLAHASPSLFEAVSTTLRRLTTHTITSPSQLMRQLNRVLDKGYAIEQEETRMGYLSVAVPVLDHQGAAVGALSITAPTFRANIDRLISALRVAGQMTSRRFVAETHMVAEREGAPRRVESRPHRAERPRQAG
jgi:DNA-binding IclR family transcriptional regulator